MRKVILASTSPRRREILEKLRIPFTVEESGYEEDMAMKLPPRELVKELALGKARSAALRHKSAIIIAGDTIIVFGKKVYGKPLTKPRAREMLKTFSGKSHLILTAFAIIDCMSGKKVVRVAESKVWMRKLSSTEIDYYVATGEPLDKAGAYALHLYGGALVKKMDGDFYGAIGLPLFALRDDLKKFGIK